MVYSVIGIKNVVAASMTGSKFEWGDFTLAAVVEALDREGVAQAMAGEGMKEGEVEALMQQGAEVQEMEPFVEGVGDLIVSSKHNRLVERMLLLVMH